MQAVSPTSARQTKYCGAIRQHLAENGHATNAELLEVLRVKYPLVTATTVHRATTRLAQRGEIGVAPADVHGSMRYDANVSAHDHFMCHKCGLIRDIDIISEVRPIIEANLYGCSISGRLTVSGVCKICTTEED